MREKQTKNFPYFLENYYLPSQAGQITKLLQSLKIYQPIAQTIEEFYKESCDESNDDLHTQLVLTISDFTQTVNNALQGIIPTPEKNEYEKQFIELGIYLIKETFTICRYSKEKYFKILKSTLQKVYRRNNWNFDTLDAMLQLKNIEQFAPPHQHIKSKRIKISNNTICLEWKGKQPLDFFISDMKIFFRLKNNHLHYLFQAVIKNFEISIRLEKLPYLLLLIDKLYQSKVIKMNGSRGVFSFLETHFKPSSGSFPAREFRKIKHDIVKNEAQKNEVETKIHEAFGKYFTPDDRTIGR